MIFKCSEDTNAFYNRKYRKQWLVTLTVNIIALSHGISLGWASPMLHKLQSSEASPLDFVLTVQEASWVGALLCAGGVMGNFIFGFLLDRIGRKNALYCLAVPHMLSWTLVYCARSVEYLYVARISGGITGGGVWCVLPIFISEIAANNIRGRLTSLFMFSINTGMLIGFILIANLDYYLIPCIVFVLPVLYVILTSFFPETPRQLLRNGEETEALQSLQFYANFKAASKEEVEAFNRSYNELRTAIELQQITSHKVTLQDFTNKHAVKCLVSGIILAIMYSGSGLFVIMNYMTTMFALVRRSDDTSLATDPNTNTIIIGVIQIIGTYTAIILVDRFGRKPLLIVSTSGMGLGLVVFGIYAFFAEESAADLSAYSSWLPLLLMSLIVFVGNIGIASVTSVTLVEIMPVKIRSQAASFCLMTLSFAAFVMLKMFPVLMHTVGLAASIWFCASMCAFGLFYISAFIPETKGKSMHSDVNNS